MFEIREWKVLPSFEEVKEAVESWMEYNGVEGADYKAGKIRVQKLQSRYGPTDQFEQLTEESILWRGTDEALCFQIEELAIKALRAMGICTNVHGDAGGTGGISKAVAPVFVVYITRQCSVLWKCPVPNCLHVLQADGWSKHIAQLHPIYGKEADLNRELRKNGLEEFHESSMEPTAVGHDGKWSDTGIPLFLPHLTCDRCGFKSHNTRNHQYHLQMHVNEDERAEANPFICTLGCGKGYKDLPSRRTHERVHCPNRPNIPPKVACSRCGTMVMNVESHQKRSNKCKALDIGK